MNNLVQNYKIIYEQLVKNCSHIKSFPQIRQPKLSNRELVALYLNAEYMCRIILNYNYLEQLKGTELDNKIERTVFNKRRRRLVGYTEEIRRFVIQQFSHMSNLFIVDSTPVEICKISRAKRSNICSTEEIQPAFGYCAAQKKHYFGYKLHLVCDENAVVHSFDFTPANIHDVNYLKNVKYNLNNCGTYQR